MKSMAVFERLVSQARRQWLSSSLIRNCSSSTWLHRSLSSSSSSSDQNQNQNQNQNENENRNRNPPAVEPSSSHQVVSYLRSKANLERVAQVEAKHRALLSLEDHKISFAAKETDLIEWEGDILAVGVTEKDMAKDENSKFQNSVLKKLDSQFHGLLSKASTEKKFTGKAGRSTVIWIGGLKSRRVELIGLGKVPIGSSTFAYRNLGEFVASVAKASEANSVAIALASSDDLTHEMKLATASAIAKGTLLGTYEDNRFKSVSKRPTLKSVDFFGLGGGGPELEKKLKYTEDVCLGINLGKELVNAPTNLFTAEVQAEKIVSTYSDVLTVKELDSKQHKDLKMGSYLGVGAASTNSPNFIHLCYRPPNGSIQTKLAIVRNGLSGGYYITTGANSSIELTKIDKGGSAAVLGAAKALGQIKPAGVEVHFIVASGTSMRLGNIMTASNGNTIEVDINDDEGRLTLADGLVYACNQGVDKIVTLATMTGSCPVVLGPSTAGIFTLSDELCKEVVAASEVAGEKLRRLPMEECYCALMTSGVAAHMVHTRGYQGASMTAALFMKQFVDEELQWLHIDMAWPVWNDLKKEATGFGIPTLVEWVLSNSSS